MATATPPPALSVSLADASLAWHGTALFDGLSLALPAASWTCLLGPSGVGKSSLLRLLAGLPGAGSGRVACGDGQPLAGRVAWMAQQDLLLPWRSVLGNVILGADLRREPRKAARDRALGLLERFGLGDRTGDRPAALSGGERQRVALARTLMDDRPVVLMDEPFSALDAITRLRLQDLAASALAGRTVLLVTHDPLEALRLGHRIHVMAGRPATLDAPLEPAGNPPRPAGDPALLGQQAMLLDRLAAADAAGQASPGP